MISGVDLTINIEEKIKNALQEDISSEDVTTCAIMPLAKTGRAELICKESGVLAGLAVFQRVFMLLDSGISFRTVFQDGDEVKKGDIIGVLTGDIRAILSGERTALNYLQRMCGIATFTRAMVSELAESHTMLVDSRKTTPNMRPFEKYAVKVGGGGSHRYNLSDGVMIKDNHIGAVGGIKKAVELARAYAPFVRKIEVEAETLEMVQEALDAGADIIMLDNMDMVALQKAVDLIGSRAQTEYSGNVTKERLKEIAATGVDIISCGALTHSAPIMDISLKNLKPLDYERD